MAEHPDRELIFATVSMAEILLSQNLVLETEKVLRQLQRSDPDNPRVKALAERIEQMKNGPVMEQTPSCPTGRDTAVLTAQTDEVRLEWELTPEGLEMAQKRARYSGHRVARLFTAAPGPRGVRTATRDIDIRYDAGQVLLRGLPKPAVHVAAVGFLANTGMFVPLARSASLVVGP